MSDDEAEAYVPVLPPAELEAVRRAWLAGIEEEDDAMDHGEATAGALAAVLDELEAAADRASRAAYAVTEIEERLEEGHRPELAVELMAAAGRLAAEQWLETVRRRRQDLEARLGEREVARVHAGGRGRRTANASPPVELVLLATALSCSRTSALVLANGAFFCSHSAATGARPGFVAPARPGIGRLPVPSRSGIP